jgi:hypothetical protein
MARACSLRARGGALGAPCRAEKDPNARPRDAGIVGELYAVDQLDLHDDGPIALPRARGARPRGGAPNETLVERHTAAA